MFLPVGIGQLLPHLVLMDPPGWALSFHLKKRKSAFNGRGVPGVVVSEAVVSPVSTGG